MKFKVKPGDRTGIEDRRGEEPYLKPRDKDSLVRGLPATPAEWKMWTDAHQRREAELAGERFPSAQPNPYNTFRPVSSPGDPGAIESLRRYNAKRIAEQRQAEALMRGLRAFTGKPQ